MCVENDGTNCLRSAGNILSFGKIRTVRHNMAYRFLERGLVNNEGISYQSRSIPYGKPIAVRVERVLEVIG
jgi:hypothetical protein